MAVALMFGLRSLVVSVHSVEGNGLAPLFTSGDRILVNRCSYGIRVGGSRLLPYSRLARRGVDRGDVVAFHSPVDSIGGLLVARCKAVPGDTIHTADGLLVIPGRKQCAKADYYWMEAVNRNNPVDSRHLGLISEEFIVGRVETLLFQWPPR